MNKQQLYSAIKQPHLLDAGDLNQLKELVHNHPYFQAGWMLYVKCLNNQGDMQFSNELKNCSIHVTNRSRLFELIHQPAPIIDPATQSAADEAPGVQSVDYFANVPDELPVISTTTNEEAPLLDFETPVAYTIDEIDEPVNISENDNCPFSDWLLYMGHKNIGQEQSPKSKKDKNTNLIDSFLSKDFVHIAPSQSNTTINTEEVVKRSVGENDDILTETLAEIYVKQKLYNKAINIFEKLGLKYPEKSIYFANRIAELKELI